MRAFSFGVVMAGAAVLVAGTGAWASDTPGNNEVRYWGLPDHLQPTHLSETMPDGHRVHRGMVRQKGNERLLPGIHPRGVRVLSGHGPTIGAMSIRNSDRRAVVTVPLTMRSTLRGKKVRGAHERVAIELLIAKDVLDSARQRYMSRQVEWHRIGARREHVEFRFTLTAAASRHLRQMTPSQRGRAVVARVTHVVDADGRRVGGIRTAEHIKGATTTLTSSRSRAQGQGMYLTVYNQDAQADLEDGSPDGEYWWAAPALQANPGQCMYLNGADGSDLSVFNIGTGMTPGQSVEHYVEANKNVSTSPSYQGQTAAYFGSVVESYSEGYAEKLGASWAAETFLGEITEAVLDPVDLLVDAFEVAVDYLYKDCDYQLSTFSLHSFDRHGNSVSQGYSLDNGYTTNNTNGYGGLADADTAEQIYDGTIGMSESTKLLWNTYHENGMVPRGSGDAGLSLNYRSGGDPHLQSAWYYNNHNPGYLLEINFSGRNGLNGARCSSIMGNDMWQGYPESPYYSACGWPDPGDPPIPPWYYSLDPNQDDSRPPGQ